ncbi:MAG: hypothetical protein J6X66_02900 [Lachnospiraceae bacterium]|nr:hypothetical protein [Lachnospiraceae bacterium]
MSEMIDKHIGVKSNTIIIDIVLSISISILFVSSVFITDLISIKLSPFEYVCIIFAALLYGFGMVSRNIRRGGLKWVLSIPISYLVMQYFWQTEFSIRALNWVLPEYGKRSAGGNLAGMHLLCIQLIICAISGIVGISAGKVLVDRDIYDKFEKRQVIAAAVIALIIVIIVVILESRFPSADT